MPDSDQGTIYGTGDQTGVGCVQGIALLHTISLVPGCQHVIKNSWELSQELKIELPEDPVMPLLGINL